MKAQKRARKERSRHEVHFDDEHHEDGPRSPRVAPERAAISLTLRAVGGLTTAEIANAFLVPEATMAQRISRAKQNIKASGVPFRLPTPEERGEHVSTRFVPIC